ncbi:MAG TPA: TetR/AcrR family transcriptional regulator [Thermoanaerobaculia bacterium]
MKSKEEVVQEYRVQSIQDATMRVIARRGMTAATMQEIADEAGVAKGTIYLYFRDRDELVEKTFDRAITELHQRLDAALESEGSFEQKLRAVLAAEMLFFREHREFFRLYISLRYPEGKRQKRTCPQYQTRLARVAVVLEQAMERGEIRRMDPARLALFISEGISAVIIQRVIDESPPPEAADIDLLAGAIVDGIRSRS